MQQKKLLEEEIKKQLCDTFLRECMIMMESISDEDTLTKLITNLKHVKIESASSTMKIKFQDILYTLTRPGIFNSF